MTNLQVLRILADDRDFKKHQWMVAFNRLYAAIMDKKRTRQEMPTTNV